MSFTVATFVFVLIAFVAVRASDDFKSCTHDHQAIDDKNLQKVFGASSSLRNAQISSNIYNSEEPVNICWHEKTVLQFKSNGDEDGYMVNSISLHFGSDNNQDASLVDHQSNLEPYEITNDATNNRRTLQFVTVFKNDDLVIKQNLTSRCSQGYTFVKLLKQTGADSDVAVKLISSITPDSSKSGIKRFHVKNDVSTMKDLSPEELLERMTVNFKAPSLEAKHQFRLLPTSKSEISATSPKTFREFEETLSNHMTTVTIPPISSPDIQPEQDSLLLSSVTTTMKNRVELDSTPSQPAEERDSTIQSRSFEKTDTNKAVTGPDFATITHSLVDYTDSTLPTTEATPPTVEENRVQPETESGQIIIMKNLPTAAIDCTTPLPSTFATEDFFTDTEKSVDIVPSSTKSMKKRVPAHSDAKRVKEPSKHLESLQRITANPDSTVITTNRRLEDDNYDVASTYSSGSDYYDYGTKSGGSNGPPDSLLRITVSPEPTATNRRLEDANDAVSTTRKSDYIYYDYGSQSGEQFGGLQSDESPNDQLSDDKTTSTEEIGNANGFHSQQGSRENIYNSGNLNSFLNLFNNGPLSEAVNVKLSVINVQCDDTGNAQIKVHLTTTQKSGKVQKIEKLIKVNIHDKSDNKDELKKSVRNHYRNVLNMAGHICLNPSDSHTSIGFENHLNPSLYSGSSSYQNKNLYDSPLLFGLLYKRRNGQIYAVMPSLNREDFKKIKKLSIPELVTDFSATRGGTHQQTDHKIINRKELRLKQPEYHYQFDNAYRTPSNNQWNHKSFHSYESSDVKAPFLTKLLRKLGPLFNYDKQ